VQLWQPVIQLTLLAALSLALALSATYQGLSGYSLSPPVLARFMALIRQSKRLLAADRPRKEVEL
jgi:hypothetical protein